MTASKIAPAPLDASRSGDRAGEAFLERPEVRDVLAWVRLLVDPRDAAAVVRALARPPIELRQVHLARVIQLARRRSMDLISGLAVARESAQVPPEARERIARFVELHGRAAADLDTLEPEAFIVSLIEIVRARRRSLLAPEDAAVQQASLERLREVAVLFASQSPGSTPRQLAAHLAVVAPDAPSMRRPARRQAPAVATGDVPSPTGEEGGGTGQGPLSGAGAPGGDDPPEPGRAPGREGEAVPEGPPEPEPLPGQLELALQLAREELLDSVSRIGGRLSELRLDTELDISHGVVRYLELLKLAALLQRPPEADLADSLADINGRLLAAATPLQREILETSTLDGTLLAGTHGTAGSEPEEHSLGPFLPRKGTGLALSASDIQTFRSCPLRYKFSRVLRIPTAQTLHQRFGITVHQVLERFHREGLATLEQMLDLLDACWRRAGLGDSSEERALRHKARAALIRYHARLRGQDAEPVWFERSFAFRLGPHHLRGRVDRVDRLVTGDGREQYELIDYKTSRPKTPRELREDVQLSLYALAAREAWQLDSSGQAYYYVLDDVKVPVPRGERDAESVKDIVLEVGEGILGQRFDPTPSRAACSLCDYRIACPAAVVR